MTLIRYSRDVRMAPRTSTEVGVTMRTDLGTQMRNSGLVFLLYIIFVNRNEYLGRNTFANHLYFIRFLFCWFTYLIITRIKVYKRYNSYNLRYVLILLLLLLVFITFIKPYTIEMGCTINMHANGKTHIQRDYDSMGSYASHVTMTVCVAMHPTLLWQYV